MYDLEEMGLGEQMTRKEVVRALREHCIPLSDFDNENQVQEVYATETILAWLGY